MIWIFYIGCSLATLIALVMLGRVSNLMIRMQTGLRETRAVLRNPHAKDADKIKVLQRYDELAGETWQPKA